MKRLQILLAAAVYLLSLVSCEEWLIYSSAQLYASLGILSQSTREQQFVVQNDVIIHHETDEWSVSFDFYLEGANQAVEIDFGQALSRIFVEQGANCFVKDLVLSVETSAPASVQDFNIFADIFGPSFVDDQSLLSLENVVLQIPKPLMNVIENFAPDAIKTVESGTVREVTYNGNYALLFKEWDAEEQSASVKLRNVTVAPQADSVTTREYINNEQDLRQLLESKVPTIGNIRQAMTIDKSQLDGLTIAKGGSQVTILSGKSPPTSLRVDNLDYESDQIPKLDGFLQLFALTVEYEHIKKVQPGNEGCAEQLTSEDNECLLPGFQVPVTLPKDQACALSIIQCNIVIPCDVFQYLKYQIDHTLKYTEQNKIKAEQRPMLVGEYLADNEFSVISYVSDDICVAHSVIKCSNDVKAFDPDGVLDAMQNGLSSQGVEQKKGGKSVPRAVWGVIAGGILLAVLATLVWFIIRDRRKQRQRERKSLIGDPYASDRGYIVQDYNSRDSENGSGPGAQHSTFINQIKSLVEEIKKQNLHLEEEIGRGAFGVVYRGTWNGQGVAVKIIVFESDENEKDQQHLHSAQMEAAINTSLVHTNVVHCLAYNIEPLVVKDWDGQSQRSSSKPVSKSLEAAKTSAQNSTGSGSGFVGDAQEQQSQTSQVYKLSLIQEYCDRGSLSDVIRQQQLWESAQGAPDLLPVMTLCQQIAKGMQHLHRHNIIHGDLKPSNILLQSSTHNMFGVNAKVADFGLSVRLAPNQGNTINHKGGTPYYVAPEILRKGVIGRKADVFSFGVLMWELYNQELVHTNLKRLKQQKLDVVEENGPSNRPKIQRNTYARAPSFAGNTPLAYALVTGMCLSPNPDQRPDFDQLVAILQVARQGVQSGMLLPGEHNKTTNRAVSSRVDFRQPGKVLELVNALSTGADPSTIDLIIADFDERAPSRSTTQIGIIAGRLAGSYGRRSAELGRGGERKAATSPQSASAVIDAADGPLNSASVPVQVEVFGDVEEKFFSMADISSSFDASQYPQGSQTYSTAVDVTGHAQQLPASGVHIEVDALDSNVNIQWQGVPKIPVNGPVTEESGSVQDVTLENGAANVDLKVKPIGQYGSTSYLLATDKKPSDEEKLPIAQPPPPHS